jgi:nitrogen regulatory protein PII
MIYVNNVERAVHIRTSGEGEEILKMNSKE